MRSAAACASAFVPKVRAYCRTSVRLQPLPRVPLVHPGLVRTGDHQWVGRLHEHRPRTPEKHRDLSVHLPGDALRPEVPLVAPHATRVAPRPGWTPAGGRGTMLSDQPPSRRLPHVMLVLIVIGLAVCVGFIAGGSLRPFERLRVHWWGIALAGLALQGISLASGIEPVGGLGSARGLLRAPARVRMGQPPAPGVVARDGRAGAEHPRHRCERRDAGERQRPRNGGCRRRGSHRRGHRASTTSWAPATR